MTNKEQEKEYLEIMAKNIRIAKKKQAKEIFEEIENKFFIKGIAYVNQRNIAETVFNNIKNKFIKQEGK
ncbi:hypothetical protein GF336_07815 [Candidatus Woesearchaeota archaeon]|nr:hypothetical protein [Candidatus Woesearchaeota archaeon]